MKRKGLLWLLIAVMLLSAAGIFIYFQNNALVTTEISHRSAELPKEFDEYKIVHLTDLHNKSFGSEQKKLIEKVENAAPDVIFFTGDLIDSETKDMRESLILMEQLVSLAPTYFVTGNHEWWSGNFEVLEEELKALEVRVLRNEAVEITEGKETIQLLGTDDPAHTEYTRSDEEIIQENIQEARADIEESRFKILLSHRPEVFSVYADYEFSLVFSGHAHGGQVRLPFFGALAAPQQGLFPAYTAGAYTENNTTMVVGRGLGNSVIPVRIFNRPEIIVMTLESSLE